MKSLGLDLSTQSLTLIVVNIEGVSIREEFNQTLPFSSLTDYDCPSGFIVNENPLVCEANPLMWVDALCKLLELCSQQVDLGTVDIISGCAQQHGSVYLNERFLSSDWGNHPLSSEIIAPLLSKKLSPIWMDSSTSLECREIAKAVGEDQILHISGSRITERFTASQIRKIFKSSTECYEQTARIHLISSFLCSIFCGVDAPTEIGDGAGTNLMDIRIERWSPELAAATAPNLEAKLPQISARNAIVGTVSAGLQQQFKFKKEAKVLVFTGDNPSAMIGMGAIQGTDAMLSLGTSDTIATVIEKLPEEISQEHSHLFGHPANGFLRLTCFKNGSLARDQIRKDVGYDWVEFGNAIAQRTTAANNSSLLLPFFVSEITPKILNPMCLRRGEDDAFIAGKKKDMLCRAVVEAQAMALRAFGTTESDEIPTTIAVAGGAASNTSILQVVSDVLQADLITLSCATYAAALGAAFRGINALNPKDYSFGVLSQIIRKEKKEIVLSPQTPAYTYRILYCLYLKSLAEDFGVDTFLCRPPP